jgi:hypothetical protein
MHAHTAGVLLLQIIHNTFKLHSQLAKEYLSRLYQAMVAGEEVTLAISKGGKHSTCISYSFKVVVGDDNKLHMLHSCKQRSGVQIPDMELNFLP